MHRHGPAPLAAPAITVLYMDAHMLVLEKPSGLLAVPGRGDDKQDCLSARAQAHWPDALIVHRLDMATSGLMVMARGIEAQRQLSRAFEKRQVHKRYQALVLGRIDGPIDESGWSHIDWPLAVDWLNRPRSVVCWQTGRPSLTRWRRMDSPAFAGQNPSAPLEWASRVEMEPLTGRTHQLRVHMQALGHPIVGDPLYAPAEPPVAARAALPFCSRLCLHATELALPHPVDGTALHFSSPCPF